MPDYEQYVIDVATEIIVPKEALNSKSNFYEAGGDKIDIAEIAMMAEEHFNIEIPMEEIFKIQTLDELVTLIDKTIESQSLPPVPEEINL